MRLRIRAVPKAYWRFAVSPPIGAILLMAAPFKVRKAVVVFVIVLVRDFGAWKWRIAKESECDQSVRVE